MNRLILIVALLCASCGSARYQQTPAPSPVATAVSAADAKPDFDLGENLTYDELRAINGRVMAEKSRRKLSDKAALELSNQEIRRASMARWQQDGKKWIIRDESSPLYKK